MSTTSASQASGPALGELGRIDRDLVRSLTDAQMALTMPILLVAHYWAFATDKRHFAIEYEFMQRPIKRWLGNAILLVWFFGGMASIVIEMANK